MKDVHSRAGGFDTVRLLAALMVLHGHMFAIAGRPQPLILGGGLAFVAVIVFFVVSGYWVSESAVQRSRVAYVVARALRILPGLAVCCAVTILLCALASAKPVNAYLASPETWGFMWNALPFFHSPQLGIPGVFEDGPMKEAVNGSLWTLEYEVLCYILVGVAAVFGRGGVRVFMIAAAVFGLAVYAQAFGGDPNKLNARMIFLLDYLTLGWIAVFTGAFAFGAWLHSADERRLRQVIAVSVIAMALGFHDPSFSQAVSIFLYGSIAIWIGRNVSLDRWATRGQDISYGVYIYAFPIQQLTVRWIQPADTAGFLAYYAVALGATAGLAMLSWLLVERPALLLKNPLARRLEGLLAGNRGHLAQQAGGAGRGVDPVYAHAIHGRSDGHEGPAGPV